MFVSVSVFVSVFVSVSVTVSVSVCASVWSCDCVICFFVCLCVSVCLVGWLFGGLVVWWRLVRIFLLGQEANEVQLGGKTLFFPMQQLCSRPMLLCFLEGLQLAYSKHACFGWSIEFVFG